MVRPESMNGGAHSERNDGPSVPYFPFHRDETYPRTLCVNFKRLEVSCHGNNKPAGCCHSCADPRRNISNHIKDSTQSLPLVDLELQTSKISIIIVNCHVLDAGFLVKMSWVGSALATFIETKGKSSCALTRRPLVSPLIPHRR